MQCLLFALLLLPQLPPAADRQERFIQGAGPAWIVSFDASRMKWSEAFEIAKLSPEMNGEFYRVFLVNLCIVDSKEYRPCGTRDFRDPNYFKNATVNIRKKDEEIRGLSQQNLSGPLATVRDFILKRQKFWRWIGATTVEYLEHRKTDVLEGGWPEAPGQSNCQAIVDRVRQATTDEERYYLVSHEWANCQIGSHLNLVGGDAYPKAAWEKAVAGTGVTVEEQFRRID